MHLDDRLQFSPEYPFGFCGFHQKERIFRERSFSYELHLLAARLAL